MLRTTLLAAILIAPALMTAPAAAAWPQLPHPPWCGGTDIDAPVSCVASTSAPCERLLRPDGSECVQNPNGEIN